MQQPLSFKRRVTEVAATMVMTSVIIIVHGYLITSYDGPVSGTYFDALIASPFVIVAVFLVAIHLQLRRFRRSRRLELQAEAKADASS